MGNLGVSSRGPELVSDALKDILIDIVDLGTGNDWDQQFAWVGIVPQGEAPPWGMYRGFKCTWKIKHCFNIIDWSDRASIAKIMPIINGAIKQIGRSPYKDSLGELEARLAPHGLSLQEGRLVRSCQDDSADVTPLRSPLASSTRSDAVPS